MPRRPRFNLPGIPPHIVQRGNNHAPFVAVMACCHYRSYFHLRPYYCHYRQHYYRYRSNFCRCVLEKIDFLVWNFYVRY